MVSPLLQGWNPLLIAAPFQILLSLQLTHDHFTPTSYSSLHRLSSDNCHRPFSSDSSTELISLPQFSYSSSARTAQTTPFILVSVAAGTCLIRERISDIHVLFQEIKFISFLFAVFLSFWNKTHKIVGLTLWETAIHITKFCFTNSLHERDYS